MFTLIDTYQEQSDLGISGYPAICLLEDSDGIRCLQTTSNIIPGWLWARAYTEGVAYIAWPWSTTDDEIFWSHVTVEDFIEERNLIGLDYSIVDGVYDFEALFEYRHFLIRRECEIDRLTNEAGKPSLVNVHTHSEFCLDPYTKVAMADLSWKLIKDVRVGEEMVGFDENLRNQTDHKGRGSSKMKRTIVEHVKKVKRSCYRIQLEDGSSIVASAQHGWVSRGSASRGCQLEPWIGGNPRSAGRVAVDGKKFSRCQHDDGTQCSRSENTRRWLTTEQLIPGVSELILWAHPWESLDEECQAFEAGWLSGFADGEGWLSHGQFGFGQNSGIVWDEFLRVCSSLGYSITEPRTQTKLGKCQTVRLAGYETVLRFLGQCHPKRFVDRTDEVWVGHRAGGKYSHPVKVVGLYYLGVQETIALQTSTKTFVAQGYLSHNSPLDGLSKVGELVDLAVKYEQPALAITDHGVCAAHPHLSKLAGKAGIKPIFGIEAYFVADRAVRNPGKQDYNHLILWAQNNQGLNNLWAASTEANRTGFYYKPRMDFDVLSRFNEGLLCSTGCLRGPIASLLREDKMDEAAALLAQFAQLFPDRLYVELHVNQLEDQIKVNKGLVLLAQSLDLPVIAAVDSHYPCRDDYDIHQIWLRAQMYKAQGEEQDDKGLFKGHQDYHLMTRTEVSGLLSYLPAHIVEQACNQTVVMAERCDADMNTKSEPPIFSKPRSADESVDSLLQRDIERLVDICLGNWQRKVVGKSNPEETYIERFEFEMQMLIEKRFTGYFDIVADYVRAAKQKPMLVGPSRGSGGGSLVAYLADITEIDPIEHDLLFARFMTKGRTEAPDFDIDFPTSQRGWLHHYIAERWGHDHVVRVGTQTRLKNKGVIRELARIFKEDYAIDYRDINAICDIIDAEESSSAGLGYPWDVVYAAIEADENNYPAKYPWLFEMASKLVGRVKSYGKHAAGIVISTGESLNDRLPMRQGDEDQMIAEFDMEALADLGLLKFDFLTLRTLDSLDMCLQDLIRPTLDSRLVDRIKGHYGRDMYGNDKLEECPIHHPVIQIEKFEPEVYVVPVTKSILKSETQSMPSAIGCGEMPLIENRVMLNMDEEFISKRHLGSQKRNISTGFSKREGNVPFAQTRPPCSTTTIPPGRLEVPSVDSAIQPLLEGNQTQDGSVELVCTCSKHPSINPYDWKEEYLDPDVWQMICDGFTKGIFQVETRDVTRLAKQLQPRSLADLSDVTTLVRPGPMKSGLTDQYFRRRAGLEEVKAPDPRLDKVLGKTFGCIVYQEDIMATCMILAGYDEEHADKVRKILGKKKVELVAEEGRKFIPACVERGMTAADAEHLWEQMAEFAKYSFNRAHALGYAVLSYWTAWYKYHYPIEFLTSIMSTIEQDRIPEFVDEARRLDCKVLPPDINESGLSFKATGNTIRYGLLGVMGVGEKAVQRIVENQPYTSFEQFRDVMKEYAQAVNAKVIKALSMVGAFDSMWPNRRQLVMMLEREASGESIRCIHKDDSVVGPNNLPCVFDWSSEPVQFTNKGAAKKPRPLPAKCTRACRNYTPPSSKLEDCLPYTPDDIQDMEKELLGVWLSSTPFERFAKEDLAQCCTAEEVEKGPDGTYLVALLWKEIRKARDRNANEMAFTKAQAQMGDLDLTIFSSVWGVYGPVIKPGSLGVGYIKKTSRGLNLLNFMPV